MSNLVALLSCLLLSVILVGFFARKTQWLPDIANTRSSHTDTVPRSGGLALLLSFFSVVVIYFDGLPDFIMPLLLLFVISLWDDFKNIPALLRLIVHFMVCIWGVTWVASDSHLVLQVLFTLVGVWVINLTNFMDGSDGLAASMGIVFLSTISLLIWTENAEHDAMLGLLLVAALLGFLVFNFPKASIFMGDTGSTIVGYFIWMMSLIAITRYEITPLIPIILFSPFWVDATVTLLWRIRYKEKVWQAHRKHSYQRLLRKGLSHGKLLTLYWLLMLFCVLTVYVILAVNSHIVDLVLLLSWIIFYTIVITWIFRSTREIVSDD